MNHNLVKSKKTVSTWSLLHKLHCTEKAVSQVSQHTESALLPLVFICKVIHTHVPAAVCFIWTPNPTATCHTQRRHLEWDYLCYRELSWGLTMVGRRGRWCNDDESSHPDEMGIYILCHSWWKLLQVKKYRVSIYGIFLWSLSFQNYSLLLINLILSVHTAIKTRIFGHNSQ